jgi:hypothetical protein
VTHRLHLSLPGDGRPAVRIAGFLAALALVFAAAFTAGHATGHPGKSQPGTSGGGMDMPGMAGTR